MRGKVGGKGSSGQGARRPKANRPKSKPEEAKPTEPMRIAKAIAHAGICSRRDAERMVEAGRVAVNGKVQRPSVCNALECLLVHRAAAERLLPAVGKALADAGVELRCDPTALTLLGRAGVPAVAAVAEDFGREFLDRSIYDAHTLQHDYDLPVLGEISRIRAA